MKRKPAVLFLILMLTCANASSQVIDTNVCLNGTWLTGLDRNYNDSSIVPGIAVNPAIMTEKPLWYKKTIQLPQGEWKKASLLLKGARFNPAIYINNKKVSQKMGGMAQTLHSITHPEVLPGNMIVLEIKLESLNHVRTKNASYIPVADHWRSNISSGLWDDVILQLEGEISIQRIIPHTKKNKLELKIETDTLPKGLFKNYFITAGLQNEATTISSARKKMSSNNEYISLDLEKIKYWSPESANIYKLWIEISDKKGVISRKTMSYGRKSFTTGNKQFFLNDTLCRLRAGTVVWHRWLRDSAAAELAWDADWFYKNIANRLKKYGANTLRFHLGPPPERFLDMCDTLGLIVQYEWIFFHGAPASYESLMNQWPAWLDVAMKHPSVSIIHPYNETKDTELSVLMQAIRELEKKYPPFVVSGRDVSHVHKYWWSLFENLGLYYDSYKQFKLPVMADEFGGNYLDRHGKPGGYPALIPSFKRFLGQTQDDKLRLKHQAAANAKIAEYWRRIGVAGFSPFTIIGSYEDGNHWFLGNLKEGAPKPVWQSLSASWSPISVSMDIWDRNYIPGQQKDIPVYLFNDSKNDTYIEARIRILNENNKIIREVMVENSLPAHSQKIHLAFLDIPENPGTYKIVCELLSPKPQHYPVQSEWEINVLSPVPSLQNMLKIHPPSDEIINFFKKNQISIDTLPDLREDDVTVIDAADQKNNLDSLIQAGIKAKADMIIINAGPVFPNPAYNRLLSPERFLQSQPNIKSEQTKTVHITDQLTLEYNLVPEPESHIHPGIHGKALWEHLPANSTWLWNGLRGGLIVPNYSMQVTYNSRQGFLNEWKMKGADTNKLKNNSYWAYQLNEHFLFSAQANDQVIIDSLKKLNQLFIEDAPSLSERIAYNHTIRQENLHEKFAQLSKRKTATTLPLVVAGKDLNRTPVYLIDLGKGQSKILISQLLMEKRLDDSFREPGSYGRSVDPAAQQMLLNMIHYLNNYKN